MIYKYTFSIWSDNPIPEAIRGKLRGEFKCISQESDGNWMSFWHPRSFATEDHVAVYEEAFVDFLEENHDIFISNGASELDIYMEIYFDGGQCNFEAFGRNLLGRLARFNVALPISIYVLEPDCLGKWEEEVRADWSSESGKLGNIETEACNQSNAEPSIWRPGTENP